MECQTLLKCNRINYTGEYQRICAAINSKREDCICFKCWILRVMETEMDDYTLKIIRTFLSRGCWTEYKDQINNLVVAYDI